MLVDFVDMDLHKNNIIPNDKWNRNSLYNGISSYIKHIIISKNPPFNQLINVWCCKPNLRGVCIAISDFQFLISYTY